jgi:hypothetical protein
MRVSIWETDVTTGAASTATAADASEAATGATAGATEVATTDAFVLRSLIGAAATAGAATVAAGAAEVIVAATGAADTLVAIFLAVLLGAELIVLVPVEVFDISKRTDPQTAGHPVKFLKDLVKFFRPFTLLVFQIVVAGSR